MIGKPAKDPTDLLSQLSKKIDRKQLIAEFKYDGERTQLHWDKKTLKMYSRSCDTQEAKFWTLFDKVKDFCISKNLEQFIADGEVVYTDEEGNFLPFQEIERKE